MKWFPLILLLLMVDGKPAVANISLALFNPKEPTVFAIHAGSAFVIDPNGILATHYQWVEPSIHSKQPSPLTLQIKGQSVAAQIIALDVVHDLALIKVAQKFGKAIVTSPRLHPAGEKVFSLGQPEDLNVSVVEGNITGLKRWLPFEQILLSNPMIPGMSGGPTLDSSGQLVGMNISTLREGANISYAVPAHWVTELYTQSASRKHSVLSQAQILTQVQLQLESASSSIAQNWLVSNNSRTMGSFMLVSPPPGLKCSDTSAVGQGANAMPEIHSEHCESEFTIAPGFDLSLGRVAFDYTQLDQKVDWGPEFYRKIEDAFSQVNRLENKSGKFTDAQCSDQIVLNSHKVKLKAYFCASGIKAYPRLFDCYLKIATLDQSRTSALMAFQFTGMSSENCKRSAEQIINRVEKNR